MAYPQEFSAQELIWVQIDHQLISSRERRAAIELGFKYSPRLNACRKGNAWSDLVDMGKAYLDLANDWSEKLFVIYTEAWGEQGKVRTPEFLCAVLNKRVLPAIEERVRIGQFEVTKAIRKHRQYVSGLTGLCSNLVMSGGMLKKEWRKRIEIEARDLQLKQGTPQVSVLPKNQQPHAEQTPAETTADASAISPLSADWLSAGDPIDGNPFPKEDPRHKVWAESTFKAEEELLRLNSALLRLRPSSPDTTLDWLCRLVVGKFDIWAKRYIQIIWSSGAAREFDRWLISYATSWLSGISEADSFRRVIPIDTLLSELRLRLMERTAWWKAEGLRYLTQQEVRLKAAERVTPARDSSSTSKPIRGRLDPAVAARRAELTNMLASKKLPSAKAICDRWDSLGFKTPENWQERGLLKWKDAYGRRDFQSTVRKLISTDIRWLRGKKS